MTFIMYCFVAHTNALGTATAMETRPNQEKCELDIPGNAFVIEAHVHAKDASRFRRTELLRWQERSASTVRWERFVIPAPEPNQVC